MNGTPESQTLAPASAHNVVIRLFGVGTSGIAVVEHLLANGFAGVECIAVSTDAGSLAASSAPVKLHIENKLLRGLGSGGDPERSRAAAEESAEKLKKLCEGASVVLIAAGLGGGSGTGISPVLARAARETGALVLGFVTTPFDCEGRRRQTLARLGLDQLRAAADGVICLPNQKIFKLIDENTSVLDTFKITNTLLADGILGMWRLLAHKGLIEIQLNDLCAVVRDRHTESFFATAESAGPARSREVVEKLLAHPMLDSGGLLDESEAVLVSLIGGPDLSMAEVNRVMEEIQRRCEHAEVVMGASLDESFRDRLAVTLIASRKPAEPQEEPSRPAGRSEELDTQLLTRSNGGRTGSRFVAPPPDLSPEKMQQMLSRQKAGDSARRKSAKLRQTQLPLEIISKGRFDKSEPTIHRGEDLDVPTYIRRGVALN
jgi:cell division protein FtsZ